MAKDWTVISNSGHHAIFKYARQRVGVDLPSDCFLARVFMDCWRGLKVPQDILEELLGRKIDPGAGK
jgi:hypothetical protein